MKHATPTEAAEITAEWLTATLFANGHLPEGRVTSVGYEIVGEGVGFMGEVARLSLAYEGAASGAPTTLISKIPTKFEAARQMGVLFRYYEREGRFFERIAAGAPVRAPRCYASIVDVPGDRYLLLLEDVPAARVGDQLAGITVDEARLAIDEIARFHAQWWDSSRMDEVSDWIPDFQDPIYDYLNTLYPQSVDPFLAFQAEDYPRERMRPIMEHSSTVMNEILHKSTCGHQVLLHGDFRLDNMLFSPAPGGEILTLIDWQLLVRANPLIDIGYLLSQSMTVETRRQHERELVERYRKRLTEGGVKGYSAEECWDDYRFGVLFMFGVPVIGSATLDLSNARAVPLMRALSERATAAILDLHSEDTLPGWG